MIRLDLDMEEQNGKFYILLLDVFQKNKEHNLKIIGFVITYKCNKTSTQDSKKVILSSYPVSVT